MQKPGRKTGCVSTIIFNNIAATLKSSEMSLDETGEQSTGTRKAFWGRPHLRLIMLAKPRVMRWEICCNYIPSPGWYQNRKEIFRTKTASRLEGSDRVVNCRQLKVKHMAKTSKKAKIWWMLPLDMNKWGYLGRRWPWHRSWVHLGFSSQKDFLKCRWCLAWKFITVHSKLGRITWCL